MIVRLDLDDLEIVDLDPDYSEAQNIDGGIPIFISSIQAGYTSPSTFYHIIPITDKINPSLGSLAIAITSDGAYLIQRAASACGYLG